MFNTAYLGSILLRRLAVALHQRRFLGFYSEGEGCCTGNDSGAVCPAILRYDSGFPFSGSEGFLGCEAEAGNGIDDQFSGTDGVVFAGIETAESETDIRVVAHQSEPLSVNGDLRWLAGRDAVVRFGIVCLFRGDSCTDEGRERVGRRLLGMDVFDLAVGGALLQAGLVDELIVYIAPKLLGSDARGLCTLPGLEKLADAPQFKFKEIRHVGPDVCLHLVGA